jgi:prepilin-type N-terminal cleavage/methylation domain-containing protein
MIKRLFKAHEQSGFVLIEMLVAIAISGIVLGSIVEVTVQTFVINAASNSQMAAVKQVENAIHWIERDAQMASLKSIEPSDSTVTNFPLELSWTHFEDNYTHFITYRIDNSVLLRREEVKDIAESENEELISDTETMICNDIIAADSNYAFDAEILEVNLTVTVSGFRSATESRTLYVIPRVSKEVEQDD